jgi:iron-sulfur cluster assembly protein
MSMTVSLSDKAAKHVANYLVKRGKGLGLRLGVRTSGCSGMAYKLEFVDEVSPEDLVFESNGVKVFVDAKSLPYLDGHGTRLCPRGPERGLQVQQSERQGSVRLRRIV